MTFDVLVVTDRNQLKQKCDVALRELNLMPRWFDSLTQATNVLQHEVFDAAVVDFDMTGVDAVEACRELLATNPLLPLIGMANSESRLNAINRMGDYLFDVLILPAECETLALRIRRVVAFANLSRDVGELTKMANSLLPAAMVRSDIQHNHDSPPFIVRSQQKGDFPSMEEIERKYTQYVLDCVDGNRSHASRILGLSRKTLWRKLRKTE